LVEEGGVCEREWEIGEVGVCQWGRKGVDAEKEILNTLGKGIMNSGCLRECHSGRKRGAACTSDSKRGVGGALRRKLVYQERSVLFRTLRKRDMINIPAERIIGRMVSTGQRNHRKSLTGKKKSTLLRLHLLPKKKKERFAFNEQPWEKGKETSIRKREGEERGNYLSEWAVSKRRSPKKRASISEEEGKKSTSHSKERILVQKVKKMLVRPGRKEHCAKKKFLLKKTFVFREKKTLAQ